MVAMTCTRIVYNGPSGIVGLAYTMDMAEAIEQFLIDHDTLDTVYSIKRVDTGTHIRPRDKTPSGSPEITLRGNLK